MPNPRKNASVFEKVLTATPAQSPSQHNELVRPNKRVSNIPSILPVLICRYATGFGLPSLNMGTFASRVYALAELVPGIVVASHSRGLGLQSVGAANTEVMLKPTARGEKRGRRSSVRVAIADWRIDSDR